MLPKQERERERFVFRQLDPSRGIRRSSIRRRHVAPSTGRLYLSRPLVTFLSIICTFLIHRLPESKQPKLRNLHRYPFTVSTTLSAPISFCP